MKHLERRPVTLKQAYDLGCRLRAADREEVKAACGLDGDVAMVHAVMHAKKSDGWWLDGKVVAISGVSASEASPGIGIVWMLASDEMDKTPRNFLKDRRIYVRELLEGHDMLFNFVDNRNIKAQRWLMWLGFQLGEPRPYGVAQLPFRPFWLHADGALECPSPGHDEVNRVEVTDV